VTSRAMRFGNSSVATLLQSPMHRVLSNALILIRYTGRRSGCEYVTPTQFARHGPDVIIFVGHPDTKTWWRNFRTEGDIEILMGRRWTPMTAKAVVGADDPTEFAPLLATYLERFPRTSKMLDAEANTNTPDLRAAVLVRCQPC
jgi:deazaflavin-dependent oxidoreductase (nitroreductase family)